MDLYAQGPGAEGDEKEQERVKPEDLETPPTPQPHPTISPEIGSYIIVRGKIFSKTDKTFAWSACAMRPTTSMLSN